MAFSYYCGADRVPAIDIWVNRIELWGYNPVKDVFKFYVIVNKMRLFVFFSALFANMAKRGIFIFGQSGAFLRESENGVMLNLGVMTLVSDEISAFLAHARDTRASLALLTFCFHNLHRNLCNKLTYNE